MKKRIAMIVCAMMILLAGCGKSTIEVSIPLGEIGTVQFDPLEKYNGIKQMTVNNNTVIANGVKDGTYYFHVTDDIGEDVEVVMTVQNGDVSVKTADGADVPFTSFKK